MRTEPCRGIWHHRTIQSEQAWELTRGGGKERPIRIAVIDNGMQINHPGLKKALVGGGYFKSCGRGKVAFVRLEASATGFPDNSHGTFCLGLAGARMNKTSGSCGVAPEADLMAIACLEDEVGTQTTLAAAIAYAADPGNEDPQSTLSDGTDIISCSLGPDGEEWKMSSVLEQAIKFAAREGRGGLGVPIFWAVSNTNDDIAGDDVCSHPDVITVGKSSRFDRKDGSAFGRALDFLAPGSDLLSTQSGSKYGFRSGSSFAAPLAAGVAALVLSLNPDLTRDEVLQILRDSCDKIGDVEYDGRGHQNDYGFGRINAAEAVKQAFSFQGRCAR